MIGDGCYDEIRRIPVKQNEKIRVEVAEAEKRVTRGTQDVIEVVSVTFEQALNKLKPMCEATVR